MEKESLNMMMAITRGRSSWVGNMEGVAISLKMGRLMTGIGGIIKDRGSESIYGPMGENIRASGEKARWMGWGSTNGQMGGNIWGNTFRTVSQGMGSTYILTAEFILVILKKVRCMGWGLIRNLIVI